MGAQGECLQVFAQRILQSESSNLISVAMATDLKVTNKKGIGFYIRAAESFLKGMPAMEALEAKDGKEAKEAKEAKDPVDVLKISGLGEAINIAVATAAAVTDNKLATITKIETEYPDMPVPEGSDRPARGCAQIVITVTRNK